MTREDFLVAAWRDFLLFAIQNEGMRAHFAAETGRTLSEPSSALESMIDEVTGKDGDDAMAFAVWATRRYWGWEDSPPSFQADGEAWERLQEGKERPCR